MRSSNMKKPRVINNQMIIGFSIAFMVLLSLIGWLMWQMLVEAPFYTYKGDGFSIDIPRDTEMEDKGNGVLSFTNTTEYLGDRNDFDSLVNHASEAFSVQASCGKLESGQNGLEKLDKDYAEGEMVSEAEGITSYEKMTINGNEARRIGQENSLHNITGVYVQSASRFCQVSVFTPKNDDSKKWQGVAERVVDSIELN